MSENKAVAGDNNSIARAESQSIHSAQQQISNNEDNKSVSDLEKHEEVDSDSRSELHLVTSNQSFEYEKSRGVIRIENVKILMSDATHGKAITIAFCVCLLVISWVSALDSSTTYNYEVPATSSFDRHSMISTVGIATHIISSVMRPILGKISDITSRPFCYILSLVLYTIGTVCAAASNNISAFVVGQVLTSVGSTGISYLNGLIVADLTPLKWRGLVRSILATPYIINVWFSGLIVEAVIGNNWRWDYGMFAIIMPVVVFPAVSVLQFYEHKAQKIIPKEKKPRKPVMKLIIDSLIEIDAFGLIVLGFGWSLLLLPFSLYPYANDGWQNPSMIAMVVVGGVLLLFYILFEIKWAPFPSMPKRVVYNKTFITAVLIDFIYQFAGAIRSQYLSSILLVSKDWSYQNWTYFNNTMTIALCFFGVVAGVVCRVTHRYKYLQVFGLFLQVVGYGIDVRPKGEIANTASFVMSQIIIGMGGSFSVVGTQTSSEASVPHNDLSLVIAILGLWSSIGAAVGSSVSAPIWTSKLPGLFAKYLPDSVTPAEAQGYFTNLASLREFPYDSEVRQGAITALSHIQVYLLVPPVAMSFISLCLGTIQTNYYLGDNQNAIENQNGRDPTHPDREKKEPKTTKEKILYLFT